MRSLAIFALASAASASILEGRQTPNGSCASSVHVIAVGGGNSADEYALGLLSTLATNITAAIPGSDYSSLPYDKVDVGPNMLSPTAIPDGITTLGQYVSEYYAACPNTKIALIGYSSGADITSLALCTTFTVPQSLAGNPIIANIWYGAETYNPGLSFDTGTCTNGSGTHPLTNPAACGNYIPLTQSYCDTNDPQCCDGPPGDYEIHFTYPALYDAQATDFVVAQYNKLGGNVHQHHSSSSASASPTSHSPTKVVPPPSSTITPTSRSVSTSLSTPAMTTFSPTISPVSNSTGRTSTPARSPSSPPSTISSPPASAAASLILANSNTMGWFSATSIGALVLLGATLL